MLAAFVFWLFPSVSKLCALIVRIISTPLLMLLLLLLLLPSSWSLDACKNSVRSQEENESHWL
jgi:hypothetical protein